MATNTAKRKVLSSKKRGLKRDPSASAKQKPKAEKVGSYFSKPNPDVPLLHSGCTPLDCSLGGGWAMHRIVNIVGDKSTGKTLLAIEACANFAKKFPDGKITYTEAEAAFDTGYAESLGMPTEIVTFEEEIFTVGNWYDRLEKDIAYSNEHNVPILHVLDSLDALGDSAELEKHLDDQDYPRKPKQLSELFRKLTKKLSKSKVTLVIISQVRDNIGVAFGEKHTRSGGKALDFYASQVLWLAHMGQIKRTAKKVERVIGVTIKAKVKKNKVGPPFREAQFPIYFSFGIDDLTACGLWLQDAGFFQELDIPGTDSQKAVKAWISKVEEYDDNDYFEELEQVQQLTKEKWAEVEQRFLPKRRKY